MPDLHLSVLTAEGRLYDAEAEFVVLPAEEGELGILPEHSPIVALLKPGALRATVGGEVELFFVSGGFVDVARSGADTSVTVLADTGERAHDIDEARALEARKRAEAMLAQTLSAEEYAEATALLERSVARVRVAELGRGTRRRRERPLPPTSSE
ncbi:MAG TPA: ATP synthase F1 subunit epsilon [Candidatus Dormibacteraeota bacterium]|jgi:F-type H+-transporting ATPase subunit epsilon|nr:ATP synthase F1 subunit epsilon [Candidatus Dormibacteraeota bacterium]